MAGCAASPAYPCSADWFDGMPDNASLMALRRLLMLVEFGRGARVGRVPILAFATSKVTSGGAMLLVFTGQFLVGLESVAASVGGSSRQQFAGCFY